MTAHEIVGEIIRSGNIDEVYQLLTKVLFYEKRKYQKENAEYRACLNAIKKINKGKNEGIDALSTIEEDEQMYAIRIV